ncbi:MAG: DUF5615 family PIN-like protein [Acidobacteria bacterium]|nr:DUF5615 family PIN-like protein [Acidobacteriota bacterium]
MKPADCRFLADENIHPQATAFLRSAGCDVLTVQETGLSGAPDAEILRTALESGRVVLTHDSDFGALAVAASQDICGIVYLRPGHIRPEFTNRTLAALLELGVDVISPFILVLHRSGERVRIRLRRL